MAEQQPAADSPDKFSILIKTWFGKTFAVPVSLDDSVGEVKDKLSALDSSLTRRGGRLVYGRRQLEDNLTLRHYEITPMSCLYCYPRCKCRVGWRRWVRILLEVGGGSGCRLGCLLRKDPGKDHRQEPPQAGGKGRGGCSCVSTRDLPEHTCTGRWEEGEGPGMHLCRRKAGGRGRTLLLEAEQEICSLCGSREGWGSGGWDRVLSPSGTGSWVECLVRVGTNWQEEISQQKREEEGEDGQRMG